MNKWIGYEEARDVANRIDLPQTTRHRYCQSKANQGICNMINMAKLPLNQFKIRYRCQDCGHIVTGKQIGRAHV